MLLWQRKNPRNLIILIGIVAGVHVLFLMFALGVVTSSVYTVRMSDCVLIPAGVSVRIVPGATRPVQGKGCGQKGVRDRSKNKRQKKNTQTRVHERRGIKKTALVKKSKRSVQKPAVSSTQKTQKNIKIKRQRTKKREIVHKASAQEEKKNHKDAEQQAVIESKNVHVSEDQPSAALSEKVAVFTEEEAPPINSSPVDCSDGEPICIGQEVYDEYLLSGRVQQAVLRYWRRPVGFSRELLCEVVVQITEAGKAASVTIQQPSGAVAYDMAARAAALKAEYPRELWNKKLVLQF